MKFVSGAGILLDRKMRRYQMGKSEEGQTVQWPKEEGETMIYNTLLRKVKNITFVKNM